MGANQSMPGGYRGGAVKLRRRSTTTGVTADELVSAGLDMSRVVGLDSALQQRKTPLPGTDSAPGAAPAAAFPASASASSPSSGAKPAYYHMTESATSAAAASASAAAAAAGATGTSAVVPGTCPAPRSKAPASAGTAASAGMPMHHSAAAQAMELPPWEIVANLSDTDWFAIRAWLEDGWRCCNCGHIRDDHGDHAKAVRLLSACGVVPPQLRGQGQPGLVSAGSSTTSGTAAMGGGVEYGSTSPDLQAGYLSDSSATSSLQGSPMRQRGAHGAPVAEPRGALQPSVDPQHPRFPFDSPRAGAGVATLGPEACPHLASLGVASGMPREMAAPDSMAVSASAAVRADGGAPIKEASKWEGVRSSVIKAVTRAQQVYFMDKEPNGTLVFDFLLSALLECTSSGMGFISSALLKADGTPYLKTHAMTNVAWTSELQTWYSANAHKGLVFTNMNTLQGAVVLTGQPVITNDPSSDPRSRGVPPGHPSLDSFMGVPLYTGTELIGIYGLANRQGDGYCMELMKELEPLTVTTAQMIYAVNERKRRKEAELHLASVVQVAKEGICSLSHSGHITAMNSAARTIFGYSNDGTKKEDVTPPTNLTLQDIVVEIDGRADYHHAGLDHQVGHVHIAKGRRVDGSIFPLEVSISRGTYDTVFYVAVMRDVSDIEEVTHKLEESEERWQYQVSGIEDGVWDWNLDENTFFFSSKWFQNLGFEPAEMTASIETWDGLVHPDDKEQAYTDLKDHLDGVSEAYCNEHRLRCKDGSYKWFSHRGRVVHRSKEGEPVHFVGTHSDITDRRKFQDASLMVKEATHHLLRLEAEYLARAGMDVHEPAMQILETAGELQGTELNEKQKECVDKIEVAGQRLVAVVRDQLECSDIDVGQVELDYHIFSVAEVVETAVLIMADRASSKGLETVIEMAHDTPLFIVSDASHCMEVVINLLSAAIHETSKGYVRIRLGAEMVFPHHDDDEEESHSVDNSDAGSVSDATSMSEDVLYGALGEDHHLHGPQLHLVITIDGTGSQAAAQAAENSIAIQTSRKLLPILGGSLSTMIDQKRGAIYTAKMPVNSHHPEYKGAMAMRALKPLDVREPLEHARVLLVGPTQVTTATISRQLNAWHVPHTIASTSPETAFLKLLPEGKLPKVVLPRGQSVAETWADGTPRSGLALQFDIIIMDCSSRSNMKADENLKKVAAVLGRDRVGVVVLTKTQWREVRMGHDVTNEDAMAMFTESEGGHWAKRHPVVLHKPMVRPMCLLGALESALVSLPGNEGVLPARKGAEDLLLLHGFLQKAATKKHKRRSRRKATGPKFKGRVLLMEHNQINIHAVQLIVSSRGGVILDSAKTLADAMVLLSKNPYDIVFLDCHLHDMEDPVATVRKLREMEGQSAEIIVTKQQLQKVDQDTFLAAGATECIARPLTIANLEKFFKEHLMEVKG